MNNSMALNNLNNIVIKEDEEMKRNILTLGEVTIDMNDFPNINKSNWIPNSIKEIITKLWEFVKPKPIVKTATAFHREYGKGEVYLAENGEELMGYLVFERELLIEQGFDGTIEVYRQVFVTKEGEIKIFYTTVDSNYSDEGVKYRINRILSTEQSLTTDDAEEFVWCLLLEIDLGLE